MAAAQKKVGKKYIENSVGRAMREQRNGTMALWKYIVSLKYSDFFVRSLHA